jgi:hypothetical protein
MSHGEESTEVVTDDCLSDSCFMQPVWLCMNMCYSEDLSEEAPEPAMVLPEPEEMLAPPVITLPWMSTLHLPPMDILEL